MRITLNIYDVFVVIFSFEVVAALCPAIIRKQMLYLSK